MKKTIAKLASNNLNIKGVLFDMDGVLVDSESIICKAAVSMFEQKGLKVKESDFLPFVGKGENIYISGVAEKYNFSIDVEEAKRKLYEIYYDLIKGNLKLLPGVKEFIQKCRDKKLKLAIATSADKGKMTANLEEVGLPEIVFDATVNGLEVERKKPFPDVFIKAASKLNLKPEECLVVEDAINGVMAAKAAGCKCLALKTSFDENELKDADWISNNLSDASDSAISW